MLTASRFLSRKAPFASADVIETYKLILAGHVDYSGGETSPQAQSWMSALMMVDVGKRLGSSKEGALEVRSATMCSIKTRTVATASFNITHML